MRDLRFATTGMDRQDSYSRKKAPQYHLPELRGMQNTQKEYFTITGSGYSPFVFDAVFHERDVPIQQETEL